MAKIKRQTMTSFSQGWREKLELSYTADGIVKWCGNYRENNLGVFKTLELPYTQQFFLGIYPKGLRTMCTKNHTHVHGKVIQSRQKW